MQIKDITSGTSYIDVNNEFKHIVFEKLEEFTHEGYSFKIRYCDQFFNKVTDAYLKNNYIATLKPTFKDVWDKEVKSWKLCDGLPNKQPTDDNKIYEIYIHPAWDIKTDWFYLFEFQDEKAGCFYSRRNEERTDNSYGFRNATYRQNMYLTPQVKLEFMDLSTVIHYNNELDILKSTISHEFYHGIQHAYNFNFDKKNHWISEGTARFLQSAYLPDIEIVFDNNNYRGGLFSYNSLLYMESFYNRQHKSLETPSYYDYCIFWRFIYENYGKTDDQMDKIREAVKLCGAPSVKNIKITMDQALGGTGKFAEALIKFAKHIYFA